MGRHDGRVIFVPYGLPGENVRVEISQDKGRYAFASIIEVLTPSEDRAEPRCPYFGPGRCGGCQWQHASYQAQLRFKASIVADQLARIGGIATPAVLPADPDPAGWAYRNHAQFHPALPRGLGFLRDTGRSARGNGGQEVVAIDACPILHSLLSDLYTTLDIDLDGIARVSLRAGTATGQCMIIFEMENDLAPALETDLPISCVLLLADGLYVNLVGGNHITEVVEEHSYRISPPSFFQINSSQAGQLVRRVLEHLDLRGDETVLDAHCGVGLFTTHLAERAGLVVGIEMNPAAVDDLMENSAHLNNVEVIEGRIKTALPDLDVSLDAAVVDPPRTGMDRFALDALVKQRPSRIVYVSCDPATLARDAKRLTRAGYQLVEVQPVDMFPQTHHIETVTLFVSGH